MTFDQLVAKKQDEGFLENREILDLSNFVSIDNKVALPIITSYSFETTTDIDVTYESGRVIGKIKFLKGRNVENIESLPNEERICFYIDYDQEHIVDQAHKFKSDYLLIEKRYFNKYRQAFKKSSAIWGSFIHLDDRPEIVFDKKRNNNSIKTSPGLKIENSIYKDNLFLSINEPNPFNRFLKLYHLLELQFDMHTAEKISQLLEEGNKQKEISTKLKEYTREEIKRLTSLVIERCTDTNSLINIMSEVKHFSARAEKIFYEYGKDSNPIKKSSLFRSILERESMFGDQDYIQTQGLIFNNLVPKLCSYWIYRVRSSIAHNKFGEYIMNKDDEDFIVNFAEPLLKEMVLQCFKK